jgi:hypothetical protein
MYYGEVTKKSIAGTNTYFKKTLIDTTYNEDYDVEIVIVNIVHKKESDFDTIRDKIKHIYTFLIANATYQVELSEIVAGTKVYEIELKYTHHDFLRISAKDVDSLNASIRDLLLVLNQTKILYSLDTKNKLLEDYTPYVRPCRFFTYDDIRVPSVQTIKAKGKKRSLIVHKTGIWLVKAPYEYNLIIEAVSNVSNLLNAWSITVYEGELVTPIQHDAFNFAYELWYLCNDCSYYNGRNVTNESYQKRFEYMKEFKNRISFFVSPEYLTFGLQTQRYSNTPDQFHENCRDLLSLADEVNYDTNGLIITPINKNNEEKLKWMLQEDVHIDFIAYHNKLYVVDNNNNEEVLFEGTKEYPFDGYEENEFELSNDRQIVSCSNLQDKLHCYGRFDKENGDTLACAMENWNYIHQPISIETIKGDTIVIADNFIRKTFDQFSMNGGKLIIDDLTPYWENEASLNTLVDYIDVELDEVGDTFTFLTLDGDAVMHLFRQNTISLEIGPITIVNNGDRTITLIDNNVSKVMYLVHLADLTQKLKAFNITLVKSEHISDDSLLTTEGNIYASLYKYGSYIKK